MGPDTPINIGLLYSFSGVTAAQELSQWRGATQAIAEINQNGGINGRPLNAIHLDPQSDDVLFRAMAEELITEHEVNVIFGGYTPAAEKRCHRLLKNIVGCCFIRNCMRALSFQKIFSMAVPRLIRIVYSWLTTSRLSLGHGFI
jgi:hypothetical protein